jgi:hypothetical protein
MLVPSHLELDDRTKNASFLFYSQKPLQFSGSGISHHKLSECNSMLVQSQSNTKFTSAQALQRYKLKNVKEEKEPKISAMAVSSLGPCQTK